MSTTYQPTLRDRLKARRDCLHDEQASLDLPDNGLIPDSAIARIDELATRARRGDTAARDGLYASLRPRLQRKGHALRPWPNTSSQTGIWERDDVDQEGWIVFTELINGWDGERSFVPYLFARFGWRLRDRILRGIGRQLPSLGSVRVPESLLGEVLPAPDTDRPESAWLAAMLLEHLIKNSMKAEVEFRDPQAVLTMLRSPLTPAMREAAVLPDDDHPYSQIEAA